MSNAALAHYPDTAAQAPADEDAVLATARSRAQAEQLSFAGSVTPLQAWQLVNTGAARLVDVRSPEEVKFVGAVPETLNVPWASGTSLNRNPRFVKELETKAGGKDAVLLLLCRSGKRSAEAAAAAAKAGFSSVFNVLEGFEGELDEQHRRGAQGGWRHRGLPWQQD
ncbi:Thiosulfate sulfurtransferase GlpE [Andreprevotia sp. IGB-42]|uniref:rhodanese-like domain-containing protein n=1 Tax=Andreprevotia sp. IGB-42 TaxID=2497473 RepID=UPI0013590480|nr:rhodanese-like domain-containing protein [Andreprevotia sp. IGB-42]KAF0815310.1 Thiosulfate sulfurtransferase GlpE [Andreprevotia sp. IGB-42]